MPPRPAVPGNILGGGMAVFEVISRVTRRSLRKKSRYTIVCQFFPEALGAPGASELEALSKDHLIDRVLAKLDALPA